MCPPAGGLVIDVNTGPYQPCLHLARTDDRLGHLGTNEQGGRRRADVTDHPGARAHSRGDRQQRRPRVPLTAGNDPEHATRVLVVRWPGARPEPPEVLTSHPLNHRCACDLHADVQDREPPDGRLGGRQQMHRLGRDEGHRLVGEHAGLRCHLTIGVSTAGQVHGQHVCRVTDLTQEGLDLRRKARASSDPDDPVDDQLGLTQRRRDHSS